MLFKRQAPATQTNASFAQLVVILHLQAVHSAKTVHLARGVLRVHQFARDVSQASMVQLAQTCAHLVMLVVTLSL